MKNWIAKRMIRRSVDQGLPLPAWVSRRMTHDSSLDRYARVYRTMMGRLVQDAQQWVEPAAKIAPVANRRWQTLAAHQPYRQVRAHVGWAIVAMALVFFGLFASQFATGLRRHPTAIRTTPHTTPIDLGQVVALLEKGNSIRNQSSEKLDRSIDSLASWGNVKIDRLLANQAEQVGVVIGRTILALDSGARQERDRIALDAAEAVDFLIQGLPIRFDAR